MKRVELIGYRQEEWRRTRRVASLRVPGNLASSIEGSRKFKVHDGKKGVGLSESGHVVARKNVAYFLPRSLLYYAQLLQHAEFARLLPHFRDLAAFDSEEVKTRHRYRPTSLGNAHQLPLLGAP